MKITDISFTPTCCGAHGLRAEYIREDGVGFLIRADLPDEITPLEDLTYSVKIFEPDGKTLRQEAAEITAADIEVLIS